MLADLSWTHIMILAGVGILIFGSRRFPEIGRSVGQGFNNLYRGISGKLEDDPPALPPPPSEGERKLLQ